MDSGITGGKIIEITDFEDPALDVYVRLTEAQLLHIDEPGEGLFVAESPLVIGRALQAGYLPVSALVERRQLGSGAEICPRIEGPSLTSSLWMRLPGMHGSSLQSQTPG